MYLRLQCWVISCLSGMHDKGLWVYDSSTIPIQISRENITSVAVSSSILVCGTQNNLIRVWSVNNLRSRLLKVMLRV